MDEYGLSRDDLLETFKDLQVLPPGVKVGGASDDYSRIDTKV